MFSTGRINPNEKITITEFCIFLRYQKSANYWPWAVDYCACKSQKYLRSLALSFFVCGVLVYVLIIVYDKKEEMDLESNLFNIQVLMNMLYPQLPR